MTSLGLAGPPQGLAACRGRLTALLSGPAAAYCASERRTASRRGLLRRGRGTTRRDIVQRGWAKPAERSVGAPAAGPSRLPARRQTGGGRWAPRMRSAGGRLGGVLSPGGAPVELRGSCWSPGGGFRAPFPTRPRLGGFVAGLEPYRTTGRWTGPGGQGVPRGTAPSKF